MVGPRPSVNGPVRTPAQKRRASARRFEILNAFCRRTSRTLGLAESKTWFHLYQHARPDRTVRVSVNKLAEEMGLHRRTVIRSLRGLRTVGLLSLKERGGPGMGPTTYKLWPYDPR
jgi:hypothetical protein